MIYPTGHYIIIIIIIIIIINLSSELQATQIEQLFVVLKARANPILEKNWCFSRYSLYYKNFNT